MTSKSSRIGIAALAASCLLGSALAEDADILREAADRAEIQALMWRYVRALDTLDADAYASVFAEDGQFGVGQNATKGRAALRQMIVNMQNGREEREAAGEPKSPPMYHVITNSNIEFSGPDEARYYSYWMTMFGPADSSSSPRVAAVGRGVDDLVRVNGQWLIRARNVAPQD